MLALHAANGLVVIVATLLSAVWGAVYLRRRRDPSRLFAHLLALSQALLIAQVALGLLLLSGGRRNPDQLHYVYGTLALIAVLSPWLYAPPVPARRLLWFVGASLVGGALAIRAYTTAA
jgi:hypothetical protein